MERLKKLMNDKFDHNLAYSEWMTRRPLVDEPASQAEFVAGARWQFEKQTEAAKKLSHALKRISTPHHGDCPTCRQIASEALAEYEAALVEREK